MMKKRTLPAVLSLLLWSSALLIVAAAMPRFKSVLTGETIALSLPLTIAVTPSTASNFVGTAHTVTATVVNESHPQPNQAVRFLVEGVNSTSGSGLTEASGEVTLTYTGPVPGEDTITAWIDGNGDGLPAPAEPLTTATQTLVAAWRDICKTERLEISGIGMGDKHNPINPNTLTLTHPISVNWVLAQVAGRLSNGAPIPARVTFTTDTSVTITLDQATRHTDHGYTFETVILPPSGQITATVENVGSDFKTPRGLVLYTKRNTGTEQWTSLGWTTNDFVYEDSGPRFDTEVLTLTALSELTDLSITAVVIDNNDDERPLLLEATAGGQITTSGLISDSTHGPLLNIVDLTLSQVPSGTKQVTVTLKSPSGNGDSLVLVGVNVSFKCPQFIENAGIYLPIIFRDYEPLICNDFFDDFSNSASGWDILDNRNVELGYSGGEYFIRNKVPETRIVQAPINSVNRYTVEVNIHWDEIEKGHEYGLIFGQTNFPVPTYRFGVDPIQQRYRLRYHNGSGWVCVNKPAPCWTRPITPSVILTQSSTNHLKVECESKTISLYINDHILWQGDGPIPCSGQVGLATVAYPSSALAYFDNFRVSCPLEQGSHSSIDHSSVISSVELDVNRTAGLEVDK